MKKIRRIFSIFLCITLLISSLSGCGGSNNRNVEPSGTPDVSISVVDDTEQKYEDLSEMADEADNDIYNMVYNAVDYDLKDRGYTTLESAE